MRRSPTFALSAIAIVALGVGATTAIFSVVDAVVFRPLPFREPQRLVNLWLRVPQSGASRVQVTAADRDDWQAAARSFAEIALVRTPVHFNLTGTGDPERLLASLVSPGFFDVLGVAPAIGRPFMPQEGTPGGDRVVLLSDGLWRRRFGADGSIVGRYIPLDGVPHLVLGVMRPEFAYPSGEVQLWRPLTITGDELQSRIGNNYVAVARLRPGVAVTQAQEEMDAITRRLGRRNPITNEVQSVRVVRLHDDLVADVAATLYTLLAAVVCLLLIACLNLGSLVAAHTLGRAREFAVRLALGASRRRVVAQCVAEVVPLLLAGGLIGIAAAGPAVAVLSAAMPSTLPRGESIGIDLRALVFSAVTLVVIGLLSALLPVLQASPAEQAIGATVHTRTSSSDPSQSRLRRLLVVAQLALVLPLLICASLLTRSFVAVSRVDPGFRREHILTMQLSIPRTKYPGDREVAAFAGRLVERVAAVPGVEAAALVNRLPLAGIGQVNPVEFDRAISVPNRIFTDTRTVTPDYFRTMGIPLIDGRPFTDRDSHPLSLEGNSPEAAPVIIIDERIARAMWPGQSAIGQRARIPIGKAPWMEIVGVVGHIRHDGLELDPRPQVYFNYLERVQDRMALVVRAGNVANLGPLVRGAIHDVDADQPVSDLRTMDDVVGRSTAQRWLNMVLVTVFAAVALLLATIGVYGLIAYGVTRRYREFGIRMALGAAGPAITRAVVTDGARVAGVGLVLGLIGAAAATRGMESMVFGVTTTDVVSFAIAVTVLSTMALIASYLPARRAATVAPAVVLRSE